MYRTLAFVLGALAAALAAGLFWLLGVLAWPPLWRGQLGVLRADAYTQLGLVAVSALLLALLASLLLFPRARRRGAASPTSARLLLWALFAAAVVVGALQA